MQTSMVTVICILILTFFLFSCIGWVMEVLLKYIQYHRFINRGFLIGPYCPIYGFGVVAITVLVGGFIGREGTIGEIFLAGLFICGALEYFVSWYMEKVFHARWWDYSQKPMNLNGRIWIGNLVLFGVASVVIVKWVEPSLFRVMEDWPSSLLKTLAIVIVVLFVADQVVSHILMNLVRREIDAQDGDNTAEISQKIHALLRNRSLLICRLHEAYPDLQAQPKAMTKQLHAAYKEYRQAVKRTKKLIHEASKNKLHQLKSAVETDWHAKLAEATAAQKTAKTKLRAIQKRFTSHRKDDL